MRSFLLLILTLALTTLATAAPYDSQSYGLGIYEGTEITFLRGDSNGDLVVDLSDAVFTLRALFLHENIGHFNNCLEVADVNNDAKIDISDPVYLLLSLFSGGRPIPEPFTKQGADPNPENSLGCTCYPQQHC